MYHFWYSVAMPKPLNTQPVCLPCSDAPLYTDIIYGLIEKSTKLNAKRLPDTAAAIDFEMQSCRRSKKAVENLIWNTKPVRLTMNEFHKHNHADWAQVRQN